MFAESSRSHLLFAQQTTRQRLNLELLMSKLYFFRFKKEYLFAKLRNQDTDILTFLDRYFHRFERQAASKNRNSGDLPSRRRSP